MKALTESPEKTHEEREGLQAAIAGLAARLRREVLISTTRAGSGHPTSCLSAADLVAALFFQFLRFDVRQPKAPSNDRFILSKGHAAPLLYAAWAEAGAFSVERLDTLRRFGSDLEGHPTPRNPWVDVATGSLGQGLSAGIGMALAARLEGLPARVFVLLGDGEVAEGSNWEAAAVAHALELEGLIALVDVNSLGQSDRTMDGRNADRYVEKFRAFGWHAEAIDGHDLGEVVAALERAELVRGRPKVIVARTIKGKGVSFLEDRQEMHGKALTTEELERALRELPAPEPPPDAAPLAPPPVPAADLDPEAAHFRRPVALDEAARGFRVEYPRDAKVATREAFGRGLRQLGDFCPKVVVLDGDVRNSTGTDLFFNSHPDRFFECYIAEQNMVGMATGLAARGFIPFATTFACFLTRAADFIRMASISNVELKLCGSHAGVSIGEDGPSQMGLEDLAMMRAVCGASVLYPSDAVSAEWAVLLAAQLQGLVYIRTTRPKTPILYAEGERFEIGQSKVLRSSAEDQVTLVGAGITLHEALKAADILEGEGVSVRVIDLFSVKPLDTATLTKAARETKRLVIAEDHYPEGGIGEAISTALSAESFDSRTLAVRELPRSGTAEELLEAYRIDARSMVDAAHELLAGS